MVDVVKLLDFGLVQAIGLSPLEDKLTIQGTILGSPPYMSPEQAAGRTSLDGRSDIYSLGGVAYYLLTGRPPFQKESPLEMLIAHAYEGATVPPSGVPADLVDIVLRCLSKKPVDRYADVDTLEKALAVCQSAGEWTEEMARAWWTENGAAIAETAAMDRADARDDAGAGDGVTLLDWVDILDPEEAHFHPGPPPKTRLVPATGKPVMNDASRVRARMSSGSRSSMSRLPRLVPGSESPRWWRAASWPRARPPRPPRDA